MEKERLRHFGMEMLIDRKKNCMIRSLKQGDRGDETITFPLLASLLPLRSPSSPGKGRHSDPVPHGSSYLTVLQYLSLSCLFQDQDVIYLQDGCEGGIVRGDKV